MKLKVSSEVHISANVLRSSAKRNPQRPVKKTSGNNTAGELKVLENSLDIFFLGPQGPPRRPAKPHTVVVLQASSFSSSRFVHKLNATVKASRTPMPAAIFSSYGKGTRQDRFIPVSTALLKKKKQLDGMHACMCMQARCLRRSSVSNRSPAALPFFPALSWLLSSWSSLLTVALCFLQSRCFSRQRAKIFKKVCLFLGVGGSLAIVLSMASAFSEHSL